MKFIDLFAGIGGFRIAFENLNNQCVFSSEINKNCQIVYKRNFNELPVGDIKKFNLEEIPDFDILTAGFPCQPFSLCGKKEGFMDQERGTLFFDIAEILRIKRPKMFLLENVKGIKTHQSGETLTFIKNKLTSLGYFFYDQIIDTYDFGIPQYRERWYCVGFDRDIQFKFPSFKKKGSTLREIIELDQNSEELKLTDYELKIIDYHFKNYKKNKRVRHNNSHCNPNSKKGKYGIYSYLKPDNCLRFYTGDISKSQIQDDYFVSLDSVAPTLIATRAPKMWDLRRHLSVLECKRLQTFPETFNLDDVSIKVAKKQLGNSVTIKVVEEIASEMLKSYEANVPNIYKKQLLLTI